MRTFLTISILISVFAISVIIKIPFLTNEVHFNNHGHIITLTTLEIWDETGIANCHFSPIQTWNNKGDKFISYYKRLEDESGKNYFVSYPPFAFIFPYIIMKILGVGASQNLLIWLSIFIHILSGFLVFISINKYLRNKIFEFSISAFMGLLTFIFFPPLLFQSINYFPELLVIPLILVLVYISISVENRKNQIKTWQLFIFGLIVFLMVYTDWLGLLVSSTLIFYLIRFKSCNLLIRKFLWPTIISSVMSLMLIFIQYVSINGLYSLFRAMAIRFVERSGFFSQKLTDQGYNYLNLESYKSFMLNLHNSLAWLGYFIIFGLLTLLILRKKIQLKISSNKLNLFLALIVLPVILHFILFFNLSAIHFGGFSKLAIPFAFIAAFVVKKYINPAFRFSKCFRVILVFVFAVSSFFSIKLMGNYLLQDDAIQSELYLKSKIIENNSFNDEAIFLKQKDGFKPEIVYLSYITKRNIMFVKDKSRAIDVLNEYNIPKGVIFDLESKSTSDKITHFSNNRIN